MAASLVKVRPWTFDEIPRHGAIRKRGVDMAAELVTGSRRDPPSVVFGFTHPVGVVEAASSWEWKPSVMADSEISWKPCGVEEA